MRSRLCLRESPPGSVCDPNGCKDRKRSADRRPLVEIGGHWRVTAESVRHGCDMHHQCTNEIHPADRLTDLDVPGQPIDRYLLGTNDASNEHF